MSYAPQAIWDLYNAVASRIPESQMGGIVGYPQDSAGYHWSRNELLNNGQGGNYSIQLALDQEGDPDAACALDITYGQGSPLMVTVTNRLLAAAKAGDPRLKGLREFCGTTDGQNTHPYDLSNGQDGPLNSWDSSHLAHVHLSIYRAYANDWTAIAPIADVICGVEPPPPIPPEEDEDDMILILNGDTHGAAGFWLSGGRAVASTTNAERLAFIKGGGKVLTWGGKQFNAAFGAWSR